MTGGPRAWPGAEVLDLAELRGGQNRAQVTLTSPCSKQPAARASPANANQHCVGTGKSWPSAAATQSPRIPGPKLTGPARPGWNHLACPALTPHMTRFGALAEPSVPHQPAGRRDDNDRLADWLVRLGSHAVPGRGGATAPAGGAGQSAAIDRATTVASSPTPNSSDDLRVRKKWTPQNHSPGTTVLRPSGARGNPAASKAGKRTQRV